MQNQIMNMNISIKQNSIYFLQKIAYNSSVNIKKLNNINIYIKKYIIMSSTIESLIANFTNPSQVKQLNLCSTSHIKIHRIVGLDKFVRLRILILNNNMIRDMSGLENLRNLRVLNLDFNQIKIVEGTENLQKLQQLYIAYNEVQRISQSVLHNKKLRVLQLAYNDITTLDSLSVLYQLNPKYLQFQQNSQYFSQQSPQKQSSQINSPIKKNNNLRYILSNLTNISLYGNPLIGTINYQSFFKMLIPSLRIIDDKNVENLISITDQYAQISGSICPQEEVVILREAINKLIQERNAVVDQLETYVNVPTHKASTKYRKESVQVPQTCQNNQKVKQKKTSQQKIQKTNKQLIKYLNETKEKHTLMLQNQKNKITQISQLYTQYLKRNKQNRQNQQAQINFSNLKIEQFINSAKSHKNNSQFHLASVYSQGEHMLDGKTILKQLKQEEARLQQNQAKIRNINNFLNYIQERKENSGQVDVYKIMLQMVLFGSDLKQSLSIHDSQKLCKKYLIKPTLEYTDSEIQIKTNLIQYNQLVKKIIYGQNTQKCQIKITIKQLVQLKNKIRNKGLLQIINQLRQLNYIENTKNLKFQKERKSFIERFQKQTEQLARSWDQFKRQKQKLQKEKEKCYKDLHDNMQKKQIQMKKKYKIAEQQEREKIIQLKRAREKLQFEVEGLNINLTQAEQKLTRRFMQLEQFQNHFNQFIEQKQHIKSLQIQINQITFSLQAQQQKYYNLTNKVKQLTLEQGILQNKIIKADEFIKSKNKQIQEIDKKKNQLSKNLDRIKLQFDRETERSRQVSNSVVIKSEQLKDYEKMCQRTKKNLNLLEQKVRNIQHMQSNKKITIKQLDQQIKSLKQDKKSWTVQVQGLQKNIQLKREQLIKLQIKIQQNKLATQNLSDINRSISDMMIRQSELKRNIIQLQIENKNLVEMKNNLLDDFRIKHYV